MQPQQGRTGVRRAVPSALPGEGKACPWFDHPRSLNLKTKQNKNRGIGHHLNTNILTKILHWLFTVVKAYPVPVPECRSSLPPSLYPCSLAPGVHCHHQGPCPPQGLGGLRRPRGPPHCPPGRKQAPVTRPPTPPRPASLTPWSPPACCW